MEAYCFQEFANALEVIPTTLAENAGLNPIRIVTELRNRHASGEVTAGINVRKGTISNILEENVIQPLLVSTSAIQLAAETVKMIMKIDVNHYLILGYRGCQIKSPYNCNKKYLRTVICCRRFFILIEHIVRSIISLKSLQL